MKAKISICEDQRAEIKSQMSIFSDESFYYKLYAELANLKKSSKFRLPPVSEQEYWDRYQTDK